MSTYPEQRSAYHLFVPGTPTALPELQCVAFKAATEATSNTKKDLLVSALDEIRAECSTKDWDGENSEPINPVALSQAKSLVVHLPDSILTPSIFPRENGNVSFQWTKPDKEAFLITFNGSTTISYATILKSGKFSGNPHFFESVPDNIRSYILRFVEPGVPTKTNKSAG